MHRRVPAQRAKRPHQTPGEANRGRRSVACQPVNSWEWTVAEFLDHLVTRASLPDLREKWRLHTEAATR